MTLKVVRTDMMNMEDGDGLDICEGGDGARGMGVRGTEVVLAPRGETGSFTQMPPTSLLCSHQPAISTLNNVPNPDPNFSDPSTSIFALSSLRKLLLPGTLRIGPISHVGTFFVDCGADDVFMDSKLAEELKVPLTKLSNPIMLRLADGDSSSTLTHRTVPLQLHIGKHVETVSFYVTSLCHGLLLGYSWLEKHNPRINWVSRMVDFDSSYCLENCSTGSTRTQGLGKPPTIEKIMPLNPEPMEPCVQDASDSGEEILPGPVSTWTLDSIHSDVYPFLDASPDSNSSIPDDILKEFTSVFSKKQSEKLPIHREFDCTIDLVPNAAPHHGKIYQLTQEEDKVMQDWIAENLAKGFIRNSSSPHGAPCFFVKQKDKLRLCMDYRGLNKNTIKDRNPIPLISEMLRTLSIGKVFTTLDLRGAYNLLRIKEGDEPKTAFITKYGQFEFLVMPFGLANAPAQFQRMMNTLFRDSIGKFVLVYLDDIVVYSEDLETHKEHVKSVLTILRANGLYCKLEKCHFHQQEISYLGYVISPNGIYTPFSWGADQEKSINDLKKAFSNSSFLAHPCDSKPFILETDASDFAISGVLSQFDDLDQIRPVAFYARQMNSAERNYEIYDKELLAIVDSFKHWRHFLQGGLHPVTVLCDHKSLEYFMSTKKLTRRQARWSLELSEYDFSITHRPGKLNGRADALSRQSDHHLENDCSNFKRILDPKQIIDLAVTYFRTWTCM
ncbi:hypothetical protein BASA83_013212 [Batrachochytrium salamandrivorans]|nr:hypothetical protein BASA83_013212 [Batrachochytrium salamandrivorans]